MRKSKEKKNMYFSLSNPNNPAQPEDGVDVIQVQGLVRPGQARPGHVRIKSTVTDSVTAGSTLTIVCVWLVTDWSMLAELTSQELNQPSRVVCEPQLDGFCHGRPALSAECLANGHPIILILTAAEAKITCGFLHIHLTFKVGELMSRAWSIKLIQGVCMEENNASLP